MNQYCYDDIEVGTEASFSVIVAEDMLDHFRNISGDNNPMHTDDDFARESGFRSRLVYGMLTASFYSTLVGVYLPGRYALLQEVETTFNKPVYVNDELVVSGVVVEKRDLFRRITIKATVVNSEGDIVSRAKIRGGVSQ